MPYTLNTDDQTMRTRNILPTVAHSEPMPRCFWIVRFYRPRLGRKSRTIKTGLTEDEAQAHCSREDTRKQGVYFDGYDYMKGTKP